MKPFLAQKAIKRRRARREAVLQAELRRRAAAQPEPSEESVLWRTIMDAFVCEWCLHTDEQMLGGEADIGDSHGR